MWNYHHAAERRQEFIPPAMWPPIRQIWIRQTTALRESTVDVKELVKWSQMVSPELLSKASASDTKQLWQLLRNTGN